VRLATRDAAGQSFGLCDDRWLGCDSALGDRS
jgi:hypothetical protein